MLVQSALLANRAEVGGDGLLHIAGAGWEFYTVPELPASVTGCVAGIIEVAADERDQPLHLKMRVLTDNGDELGSASTAFIGVRRLFPFTFPLGVVVTEATPLHVEILDGDDGVMARLDCEVRLPVTN